MDSSLLLFIEVKSSDLVVLQSPDQVVLQPSDLVNTRTHDGVVVEVVADAAVVRLGTMLTAGVDTPLVLVT